VHLAVQGKVEPGYTITSVDIKPPTVTIAGPSRGLAPLAPVTREAFDLKGLTSDTGSSVDIVAPNPALGFSTGHVDARVNVEEAITEREFRAVDVEVRDSGFKYRVEPRQATL